MSDVDAARAAIFQAQELLDAIKADSARWDEFLAWLSEAIARAHRLDTYYRGQGQIDIDTVLTADPRGFLPDVANEDSAWDALVAHETNLMRLLRLTTREVTRGLDDQDGS